MNSDKNEKYIMLKAIKRIGEYTHIAKYENKDIEEIKKLYPIIDDFFKKELGNIDSDELKSIENTTADEREKINKIFRNQFSGNSKRKDGFGHFENFYSWYKKQGSKCYYCEITSDELDKLFVTEKLKSYKFTQTLQIEQLDPKKGYSEENCRLACALCNNTKSDLISKENYKKYFANSMKKFLNDLLNENLENNTF